LYELRQLFWPGEYTDFCNRGPPFAVDDRTPGLKSQITAFHRLVQMHILDNRVVFNITEGTFGLGRAAMLGIIADVYALAGNRCGDIANLTLQIGEALQF